MNQQGLGTNISNQVCLALLSGVQVWQSLWEKRQRQKMTPSRNPNCQTLVSSTCSLKLAPFQREELTMDTVMAICSGSQENEKHIEPCGGLQGRRSMVGPCSETNLAAGRDHRALSQILFNSRPLCEPVWELLRKCTRSNSRFTNNRCSLGCRLP